MTNEEAIIDIRENIQPIVGGKSLDIAISALEKQIPKKPIIRKEEYSAFYDCPCCGRYFVSKIDGELCGGQKYDYCFKCGTKIDWSDTE